MPALLTTYRCLLISPSDVQEERDAITRAVDEWNGHVGAGLQARIEIVRWESHARPEMGAEPQAVINKQLVNECDFGIAVFWCRLGSPTENHLSGSAEEVERLLARGANVMVYFSQRAVPQDRLRDDQFAKLQELRREYEKRGLLATYESTEKLTRMVVLHATNLVSTLLTKDRAASQPIPSTGTITAPKPDIRVSIRGVTAGQGSDMRPFIAVEIQNHSPNDFFFGSVIIPLDNNYNLFVARDSLTREALMPRKIESGNGMTVLLDPTEWKLDGAKVVNIIVRDKIDRTYPADAHEVALALESDRKTRNRR